MTASAHIEFAVNYSEQAAALLRAGEIEVDRLKCADWPDMIAAAKALGPVYVHFPLTAGAAQPAALDLDAVEAMARDTRTPLVNLHLVADRGNFPGVDLEDRSISDLVAQRMVRDVARVAARFGADRVAVENVPFGPAERFMRCAVEPAIIRRVLDETGCGLLLDLSHARIAACHLGLDARDYIMSLPVERLRELHLTGLKWIDGRLRDHMELTDEDFAWAEWAMGHIRSGRWARPWIVALEYGGIGEPFAWRSDVRVLRDQVPRLRDIVASA